MHGNYNPYAPPPEGPPLGERADAPGTLSVARLEGEHVVLRNGSALTPVCLKCGVRHDIVWRRQRFTWSPPWTVLLTLCLVAGPAILSIMLHGQAFALCGVAFVSFLWQKRSEFQLPFCATCHRRWKQLDVLLGVTALSILAVLPLGMASGSVVGSRAELVVVVGSVVAWIAGTVMASARRKKASVAVRKIDASETWLEGVHPDAARVLSGS